nr:hypothetical protein [Tanacetum cinerariifolium]
MKMNVCVWRDKESGNVAAEILKAATGVLAQDKQILLLKNVITKENPHEGRKRCQKAKEVREDIKNASKIRLKFTTSSSKMGNPQKSSCGGEEDGTEGPMIIEAEMGGHFVHHMYVDGGDEEHSMFAWINFMAVRSPSPYNRIIGRPGVKRIQAVPSTDHEKLKFAVAGEAVTFRSSRIIPLECTVVLGPGVQQPVVDKVTEEKIQVAIHLEYP